MKKTLIPVFFFTTFLVNISIAQTQVTGVQTPCTTAQQDTAGDIAISCAIREMTLVESLQKNGLLITQGIMQAVNFC